MRKGIIGRRARVIGIVTAILLIVPVAAIAGQRFDDVGDDNIFKADIEWLASVGVTKGCNPPANTEFCPEGNVTRQQMAAFMHRLATNRVVDAATLEGFTAADLMGSVGPAGPVGPAGVDGSDGADGATGPAGPAGADGATGPVGPAGADGADGATGPVGPAGADGADGATGPAGPVGPAGADGADGATGPAGPALDPVVTQRSVAFNVPNSNPWTATATASCLAGETVVGGGVVMNGVSHVWANGPTSDGWKASVSRSQPSADLSGTVYAICVDFTP